MKKFILYGFLVVIIGATGCVGQKIKPAAQVDKTPIYMEHHVPFRKHISVRDAVRRECNLGGKLATHINNYAKSYHLNMMEGKGHGKNMDSGRTLEIEIVDVDGAGGGAWSGAKMVAIEGELMDHGKVIGSFRAVRSSTGGAFGAYKGTCSILGRTVKALGKDVALWLQHPDLNASLGEARRRRH
ncbi:hypothetical protein MNBD_GAMMA23-590 [hydrothermal vent metagenome]|uniref:Lipoprotein n=1 Tax=hydrothermal vent metagenome TaxID=652676 RepID=A0A3B1ACQ2_9ZZZZ